MRILLLTLLFPFFSIGQNLQNPPRVNFGSIQRIENFPSQYVSPRHIDVWLPPGFSQNRKYPVVYFQDGQMLFDTALAFNKKSWFLDQVLGPEIEKNRLEPMIIVGIWNSGNGRYGDYFPEKPFLSLPDSMKEKVWALGEKYVYRKFKDKKPNSDAYLKFLVEELKPLIESRFPVRKGPKFTSMAGSSTAALVSMYALCEYPEVFGNAFCLSTNWPGIFTNQGNSIPTYFQAYMKENLPKPGRHFLYFDRGDQSLDSLYAVHQNRVDQVLIEKGFKKNKDFISLAFPDADHSEKAWNNRILQAFEFRFSKKLNDKRFFLK